MFDPEKVERWCESGMLEPRDFVVSASDYDQLLELYRKQQQLEYDGNDPNIDVETLPTIEEMRGILAK